MKRVFVKLTVHPEVNLLFSRSKPFDWLVGHQLLAFCTRHFCAHLYELRFFKG